jgi:hypothetical protein
MQNFDATGTATEIGSSRAGRETIGCGKSHEIAPTFLLSFTSHLRY